MTQNQKKLIRSILKIEDKELRQDVLKNLGELAVEAGVSNPDSKEKMQEILSYRLRLDETKDTDIDLQQRNEDLKAYFRYLSQKAFSNPSWKEMFDIITEKRLDLVSENVVKRQVAPRDKVLAGLIDSKVKPSGLNI